MSNANRPSGLSPVQYLNGAAWTGGGRIYCIPSTDSTYTYAIGDPVASAGSADSKGIPTVTLATAGAGNAIRGVIVATNVPGAIQSDPIVIPQVKSKDYYVMVVDDPMVVFEVQEIGTGTYFTATEVGLNADLVSGTNNGYVSGWMLNNSGEGTTANIQCRILQLAPRGDNAFGQYAKYWVSINNHELHAAVAGV